MTFKMCLGTSLVVQWLGLCASTAGATGLIPGWGTKKSHQNKIKSALIMARVRVFSFQIEKGTKEGERKEQRCPLSPASLSCTVSAGRLAGCVGKQAITSAQLLNHIYIYAGSGGGPSVPSEPDHPIFLWPLPARKQANPTADTNLKTLCSLPVETERDTGKGG